MEVSSRLSESLAADVASVMRKIATCDGARFSLFERCAKAVQLKRNRPGGESRTGLVGGLGHFLFFPYIGNNHPN